MHTGDSPTTTRIRKVGLTVRGTITPNLDRILETDEGDMRRLVIQDLTALLLKVHKKYGFTAELPKAE
jgi:seryl-tRNA(Sec) selenium transferase